MDLKAFARGEVPITEKGFAGITKRDFPKPLIAAVNGSALAGGFEIMLSCDLVVAADHAPLRHPRGVSGPHRRRRGLIRLAKRIPSALALELALTAAPIDAQRAPTRSGSSTGWCRASSWSTPRSRSPSRSRRTRRWPCSVSKQVMIGSLELDEAAGWALNDASFGTIGRSHDAMEGAIAFAEKREPNWTGA